MAMSFVPLPRLVFPTLAPLFRHHERAIDKALGQIDVSPGFQVLCQRLQQAAQRAVFGPLAKAAKTTGV
jgi:hypothetical protein